MYGDRRGGGRREGGFRGDRGGFGGGGRGFGGGGFQQREKPVKVGEEYDVKITDVGAKGDGITKVNSFIIFVPNTQKNEECRIKIKEVANKFAIGEKVGEGSETSGTSEEATEYGSDEQSTEEQQ
ncbi:MAG: TRAM domain-containing protein [Candidatus Aenigmarchaeota archaeon]|nr:TRAM domain-containing protein [Candidatus Aenigmarchaeota archaeon]